MATTDLIQLICMEIKKCVEAHWAPDDDSIVPGQKFLSGERNMQSLF
jgi:hypothetical protein